MKKQLVRAEVNDINSFVAQSELSQKNNGIAVFI